MREGMRANVVDREHLAVDQAQRHLALAELHPVGYSASSSVKFATFFHVSMLRSPHVKSRIGGVLR